MSRLITVISAILLVSVLMTVIPGSHHDIQWGEAGIASSPKTEPGIQLSDIGRNLIASLTFQWGRSDIQKKPVLSLITERLDSTLILSFSALILSMLISFPLGIIAALRQGKWIDRMLAQVSILIAAFPSFSIGPLYILFFAIFIPVFPVSGHESIWHLFLPALTLATGLSAPLSRLIRNALIETLRQDYITTARAKGLAPSRIILHHGLRNALIPVVSLISLQMGGLLTGAIITETIFDWPGLGLLFYRAILGRDWPLVQGCVVTFTLIYLLINFLTDHLYAWINPKVRI